MKAILVRGLPQALAFATLLAFPGPAPGAEIPLYDNGADRSLNLEIRAQLQFFRIGGDGYGEDKLFFRRLRPTLEASFGRSFQAEAELDFGETIEGEAVEYKDLFLAWDPPEEHGFRAVMGNAKAAFSRQYQSSSKRLTLIERGFVGIDDFGTLDRVIGGRVEALHPSDQLNFVGSFGLAAHEPDASQMEFESPLNVAGDANLGWVLSGRFELSPLGTIDYDQVTFPFRGKSPRFALGAAGYRWQNNDRRNLFSNGLLATTAERADLDGAQGGELIAVFRGFGISADAEAQWVRGETLDPGFTGGIYSRGVAELNKLSVVSGYMLLPGRLELTGSFDRLHADAWASAWKRFVLGTTYYLRGHDLKLQLNYVIHRNFLGEVGDHPQSVAVQFQLLL